jgi:hypothetical protein
LLIAGLGHGAVAQSPLPSASPANPDVSPTVACPPVVTELAESIATLQVNLDDPRARYTAGYLAG